MRKLGVLRLVLVLILALVPVPGMCSFVAAAVSQVLEVANPDTTYWVSYNGQAPWANCKGATPLNGTEACALSTANANASAGDTVYLRGGTYSGQEIRPVNSGISESARLVFTSYAQEEVLIRDAAYGIYIYKQSYITVNGINFYSLRRFFRIYAGHYNTISACDFDTRSPQSGDWAGAIIADDPNDDTPASENSTYNWVHHCTFYRWVYGAYDEHRGGLLDIGSWAEAPVDESDYNLIENNVFAYGGHHTLGVYSRYNVIRNNYIHNETNPTNWDFEGYRGAITEGPAAGYNLYAGNRFGFADASGLALRSRHNILRFNTFYHNGSGGIQVVSSAAGQDHADYNRIYHNTFYHNGHLATDPGFQGGMYFANWSNQSPVGNVVKNNIFYDNKNGPVTYEGQIDPQVVENNWDQNDLNPGFVALSGSNPDDPSLPDLRLESASPAIDEGIWLTTITSAGGSGAAFSVADAGYFTDGWDVVEGDLIQLANGRRARILDVNYETNTLTVDTTLSWTQGMGISLAYRGAAPDLGAYEFEPELTLRGAPGDGVIHLDWRVNTALPVSATWTINYETPNSVYLPITGLTNTLRAHILTNLTNYVWYTVTLHAMDGATAIMSDTVRVMPTDKRVYLPLVLKSGQRFALDRATELSAGYALAVEAEHGYVVKQLDQEGNAGGQMMRLIARPAAGYKFARWEGAATGTQPVAEVAMTGAKTVRAVFEAWAPPIGIPAPAFGIFETYRMYDNVAKRNSVLTYTQNTEGGYYTHYVNPNHPQATNTHNPYGTASKPRTTLPSAANVPEGSVIEIGGDTTLTGQLIFQVVGTAERPIFVRGADPANPVKLTGGELYLRSAYLILENISRPDESLTVRSSAGVARAHHISVRNSTLWRAGALS
ncbi:MAG TPA: right-handed parallel beta-helix repeat-containing protein, partial [Anaerolineae bacterium]|nr:right-handed parallel beta-helix repeat-containing protein [Anaerolineae bacterium]